MQNKRQQNNQFVAPMNLSPLSNSNFEEVCIGDKKVFKCLLPDCGKTFKFKSEMKRHQTIHSGERPYVCSFPDCGKTFKRADALSNHFRIHSGKTPFDCPLAGCNSQFNTKSALRYHLLKHKGEKAFKCTQPGCGKAFLTFTQLKQHEKASYYHQKVESATSQTEQTATPHIYSSQSDETCSIPSRETPGYEQTETPYELQFAGYDYKYEEDHKLEDGAAYPTYDYNNTCIKRAYSHFEERPDETTAGTPELSTASYYSKINSAHSMIGMMGFNFMIDEPAIQKKMRYTYEYPQQLQQCNFAEKTRMREEADVDLFFKKPSEFEPEEGPETNFGTHFF